MVKYKDLKSKVLAEKNRGGFCEHFQCRGEFMKKLMAYLKDESGQTSTEYILLVAVVAMIIFKFKSKMDSGLTGITEKVFEKANGLAEKIGTEE